MIRPRYPLQWPDGQSRTLHDKRTKSKFGGHGSRGDVSVFAAAQEVLDELRKLGARNPVITSDLPTRSDGLPYADSRLRVSEPGIAVWFEYQGSEKCFACDQYRSAGENMRSIALTIDAIRGIGRWGVAGAVERAMKGFIALPPGSDEPLPSAPPKRPWREVLNMPKSSNLWEPDDELAMAKFRYRKLMDLAHPDRGGDPAEASAINQAWEDAQADLKVSPE